MLEKEKEKDQAQLHLLTGLLELLVKRMDQLDDQMITLKNQMEVLTKKTKPTSTGSKGPSKRSPRLPKFGS